MTVHLLLLPMLLPTSLPAASAVRAQAPHAAASTFASAPSASSTAATARATSTANPDANPDEFPDEMFWRMGKAGTAHKAMTGKPAPELKVKSWSIVAEETPELASLLKDLNANSNDLDALKGKVVVVDFWATWCGPCRAALPENVEMMKELGPKGLVVLGVHDASRGGERMNEIAKGASINYPLAIDDSGRSAAAWKVGFWPTYGVIDRKGILRAVGLQPQHVRTVAEKLLAEPAPEDARDAVKSRNDSDDASPETPTKKPSASDGGSTSAPKAAANARPEQLPEIYLEGDARKRARLAMFDLCPEAPSFGELTQWTNAKGLGEVAGGGGADDGKDGLARQLSDFKGKIEGKIVVLDFWATWCGPCIQSIPKNNEIARMYADRGVVLIGVCHKDGGEKMVETIRSKKIEYPCAIDAKGEANAAYKVDGYPDYVIIDREGRVRGVDVQNGQVQNAIEFLLHQEEKAKSAAAPKE